MLINVSGRALSANFISLKTLIEVNAIDGVSVCPRYTVKCQKATRVTRIGEPFLVPKLDACPGGDTGNIPNCIPESLDKGLVWLFRKGE